MSTRELTESDPLGVSAQRTPALAPCPRHRCHAVGCEIEIPARLLMCRRHWNMVPLELQRPVWRHYRRGQETDKRVTREYIAAARAAIDAVAKPRGAGNDAATPEPEPVGAAVDRCVVRVRRVLDRVAELHGSPAVTATCAVIHGDALAELNRLGEASVDGVITDPPYCSGALWSSGRKIAPERKYQQAAQIDRYDTFLGEARDQRSYYRWSVWWMSEALRSAKPGAPLCVFTDWRQLPTVTDAVQGAGWVWRGVAVWDKTPACRPQMGRFAAQAEFVVWASNGDMPLTRGVPALPGVFSIRVDPKDKHHIAGKPVPLMRELVEIVAPGGLVLDPFAGSGSTGLAAVQTGRGFLGIELHAETAAMCSARLDSARAGVTLRDDRDGQLGLFGAARERAAEGRP